LSRAVERQSSGEQEKRGTPEQSHRLQSTAVSLATATDLCAKRYSLV
jgi:hypothetical protein